jgi:hypothetical protein
LDVATGKIRQAPFDSSVSEVVWVGDKETSILYINGTNDEIAGGVTLYTADIGGKKFSPYVSVIPVFSLLILTFESIGRLSHLSTPLSRA